MQALQVFWQGINSEGQPCEGILIEAGGLEQIRQQLHHQGFFQLQINTVEPAQLQKPLRVAWLAEMTGQWNQLADSGLPLKDCLRFLIRSQSDPANKFRLHNALRHLESGNSLQESFQIAKGFPDLFTRLLAVAENSDQLPTILRALQQLYVLQEQERQERWQLLRYPLTIAGFALAIFLATTILLVPLFRRLYLAQGDELFWLSASLLKLSDSLRLQPLPWLASLLTIALITILVLRKISISQILNWFPWLGRLQQTVQIQLYSQALALMTKVELPLLDALELASPLLPKNLLTRQLRIQQSLLQGRKLYQAYQEANFLTPEQLRLLDLGESSEQIAYAFQRIADHQLQQIQRDRQRLQAFLQPFFMVLVALMVLALLLALYMPLFQMGMTV
ncbi:MAG: type II secretion system F family protein [bacterium]